MAHAVHLNIVASRVMAHTDVFIAICRDDELFVWSQRERGQQRSVPENQPTSSWIVLAEHIVLLFLCSGGRRRFWAEWIAENITKLVSGDDGLRILRKLEDSRPLG